MRKVLAGITLVALLAIAPLARAATIFDDGFETGIGNWVSSNIVPVTSPVHMGAGAVGNPGGQANASLVADLPTTSTEVWSRVWVNVDAQPSSTLRLFSIRTASDAGLVRVFRSTNGTLSVRNDVTGIAYASSQPFSLDTWHLIELHVIVAEGSGTIEVAFDGTTVGSLTGSGNRDLNTMPIGRIALGASGVAGSIVYYDDVSVADASSGSTLDVTGYSPNTGAVGTPVTLTGSGFEDVSAVTFSDGVAAAFVVQSASVITTEVPVGASTGPISVSTPEGTTTGPTFTVPTGPGGSVLVAAAGDVCNLTTAGRSRCNDTGNLIVAGAPDAVLVLGDLAYESGTAAEFASTGGYRDAWGIDNPGSFYGITYPAAGNHEYNDPINGAGAEGYRAEYAARGLFGDGNLYYSFDLGAWHLVALDTDDPNGATSGGNTFEDQPGIEAGSVQANWFASDLAADSHTCDIAYGHHPRWSSGSGHGSQIHTDAVWDIAVAAGVDIWLSGHDHIYERFAMLDGSGAISASGTRSFVVGTGGTGLNSFATPLVGSQARLASGSDAWGALFLTLDDGSYSWEFKDRQGDVRDAGGPIDCH